MVFPEDLEEDHEDRRARREDRKDWLDEEEREQIAEGDISVSDTASGREPTLDSDEFDEDDEFEAAGMYIDDVEDEGGSDDPIDHYLEDDDGASDDYEEDDELENETLDPLWVDDEETTLNDEPLE